jgi:hypothetical protein
MRGGAGWWIWGAEGWILSRELAKRTFLFAMFAYSTLNQFASDCMR